MSNVINQIIEIDLIAQNKLDAANKMKDSIMKQIEEKSEQTTSLITEKTNARIARMLEMEQQYAQQEMDKIKENTASVLEQLEQSYTQTHEKLEQEIFDNVVFIH